MNKKSAAMLAAMLLLLTSCIFEARFTDVAGGRVVHGSYDTLTKSISVTLPGGESFDGKYHPLDPDALGDGSLFQRVDVSTYLGFTGPPPGWKDWHAVLKGSRGTTMEVIFRYNGSMQHGSGFARTDKGGEYRVAL